MTLKNYKVYANYIDTKNLINTVFDDKNLIEN